MSYGLGKVSDGPRKVSDDLRNVSDGPDKLSDSLCKVSDCFKKASDSLGRPRCKHSPTCVAGYKERGVGALNTVTA